VLLQLSAGNAGTAGEFNPPGDIQIVLEATNFDSLKPVFLRSVDEKERFIVCSCGDRKGSVRREPVE
jgi:hypothetical protein